MARALPTLSTSLCEQLDDAETVITKKAEPEILQDVLVSLGIIDSKNLPKISGNKSDRIRALLEEVKYNCSDEKYTRVCQTLKQRGCHLVAQLMLQGTGILSTPMSDSNKEALLILRNQKNLKYLNPEPATTNMYSEKVLTDNSKQLIESARTRIDQCCALLDILLGQPEWAYYVFLDALYASGQAHVVQEAMSKKMGKVMQRKVKDFDTACADSEQIDPRDRVTLIIKMQKENKTLDIPLPMEIHINCREYERNVDKMFKWFGRKTVLQNFFALNQDNVTKLHIDLTDNSWKLLKMRNLEDLHIENSIDKNNVIYFYKLIEANLNLKRLSIKIQKEFCAILRKLETLELVSLEILDIDFHISNEKVDTVQLARIITTKPNLRCLSIRKKPDIHEVLNDHEFIACVKSQNVALNIGDIIIWHTNENLKALSSLPTNTEVTVTDNKVNMSGWRITVDVNIVKGIAHIPGLTYLEASHNNFTPEAVSELFYCVQFLPKLQELRVYNCGISDESCVALVSSLSKYCHQLAMLDLRANLVSNPSLVQMLPALQLMKQLRKLWLSGNPCCYDSQLMEDTERKLNITNPKLGVRWSY